jgi:glycosyltransferase involved in cell wall biosynthesis
MRVLHFTSFRFGVEQIRARGEGVNTSGGWVAALLGRMLADRNCEIASAAFGKTASIESCDDNPIECFVIRKGWRESGRSLERSLERWRDLVNEWKPDLLHIHGTETAYGLLTARGMVKCPAVISLQGLLGPCSEWYHYFGNRSLTEVVRMHRWLEIPMLRGHFWAYWNIRRRAKREREIIQGNRFFVGRTRWDRAYLHALNPAAVYYHEPRLVREAFWGTRWALARVQRHRVCLTSAYHPRKGAEVLLEAIRLLKSEFPDIRVCIAGYISRRSGYGRYLRRQLHDLGGSAVEVGQLNAKNMADEFANSHVFVSSSFIENNANGICEAQVVGMPVIATYTGGVPSLIEDGRTGLFFPAGDSTTLAARIREVFDDDALAKRLGEQAHEVARKRHDPVAVVQHVLAAYEDILKEKHGHVRLFW